MNKIETSLKRAVQDLPAPDFHTIATTPVQRMEVHDYVTRQMPAVRPRRRGLSAALAACAAALALAVGLYGYLQYFQIYSVVDLTINPSFALKLNRQDEVREIEALNDDAEELLEGRSYRGWDLETAVGTLLDELTAKGYLDSAEDEVSIAVSSKSAEHSRELREEIEGFVAERLSALPVAGGDEVETIPVAPAAGTETSASPQASPSPAVPDTAAGETAASSQRPEPSPAGSPSPSPSASQPEQSAPAASPPSSVAPSPSPSPSPSHDQAAGTSHGSSDILTEEEIVAVIQAWRPDPDIHKLELDVDDDEVKYEVEFRSEGLKYEADIDAYTGEIFKWEVDD